jgi:hypothetical protein
MADEDDDMVAQLVRAKLAKKEKDKQAAAANTAIEPREPADCDTELSSLDLDGGSSKEYSYAEDYDMDFGGGGSGGGVGPTGGGVQGGELLELTVPSNDGKLGMRLGVLPQVGYVVVLNVLPGGVAEQIGVVRGDALLQINGQQAQSVSVTTVVKQLASATYPLTLQLSRGGTFMAQVVDGKITYGQSIEEVYGHDVGNYSGKQQTRQMVSLPLASIAHGDQGFMQVQMRRTIEATLANLKSTYVRTPPTKGHSDDGCFIFVRSSARPSGLNSCCTGLKWAPASPGLPTHITGFKMPGGTSRPLTLEWKPKVGKPGKQDTSGGGKQDTSGGADHPCSVLETIHTDSHIDMEVREEERDRARRDRDRERESERARERESERETDRERESERARERESERARERESERARERESERAREREACEIKRGM